MPLGCGLHERRQHLGTPHHSHHITLPLVLYISLTGAERRRREAEEQARIRAEEEARRLADEEAR